MKTSRRSFLKRCSLAGAAAGLPAWCLDRELAAAEPGRKLGPNDRPSVALIGCGGMGRGNAMDARRFAEVVAVCDVDQSHGAAAAKMLASGDKTPAIFKDFRRVMERDDIDAIINATPDHWHTLINVAAAKARKDVYGQKPLTLTIDEGRQVVGAARENKIVFQTGSQQRSSGRFRLACELVRNERIGKLREITVWLPAGLRGGPFASSAAPPELNWDFWLGQAPQTDYVRQRCHGSFRFWYDYAGGEMTDWGAHHNDIALWALGLAGPVAVEARRLAEPIPGGYTTHSEFEVTYTYSNGVKHIVKTTRDDNTGGGIVKENGQRNGIKFEGGNGWIWVNRAEIEASDPALLSTPLPAGAPRLEVSSDHMRNFFDCVRSRRAPIAEAEAGHRSASVCHLGVIALRLGQKLEWDPGKEKFAGENAQEANGWIAREMRKPFDYHFA